MISVIVPIYKVEPYLRQCVDSILAQTYSNLEIILVNDGSPDNCGAICDEYAAMDSRVKVIHQVNSGVSAARNVGLDSATGDYITFVDADDMIDANMFESLLKTIQAEHADIVECNYRRNANVHGGTGNIYPYTGIDATIILFSEDGYPKGFLPSPFCKLIDSNLTQNIRFLEGCSYAEDMLYVVSLFCKAARVVKLDQRFYTYRITPGSATNHAYRISKADEVDAAYHAMLVMQETKNSTLYTIGAGRYTELLLSHWYKCYCSGPEGIHKANELRQKLKNTYSSIKYNLSSRQQWKCKLLIISPFLFCRIYKLLSGGNIND